MNPSTTPESIVREIKRRTRKKYSSEEKIRIVLEGLRGETGIADLCRKEGLNPNIYYKWSKEFLEAGKKRFQGDTVREATSGEVVDLKKENDQLKLREAEVLQANGMSIEEVMRQLGISDATYYHNVMASPQVAEGVWRTESG
jgi:transposase